MQKQPYPILEYDPAREALIEPGKLLKPLDRAPHGVLCFFREVIAAVTRPDQVIYEIKSELGPMPIYEITHNGQPLIVAHPGVGAPLAAGILEELIALGVRNFIACGGAGALMADTSVGHLVIPTSAVRDEGTSYHYAPPSREIGPTPAAVAAIEATLAASGIDYLAGKTWTTDAFYRETPDKIALRKEEGCLTVEMEAATFFAVAQFRSVNFGQILYCGDDVSGENWDSRRWQKHTSIREKLFWLAADAVLHL